MNRLIGFDGARAIACILVFCHHLFQRIDTDIPFILWLEKGEIGVSLFFVLSGTLLSYPFWKAYIEKQQMPSLKNYALLRSARILPAFYVTLIITSVVSTWLTENPYDIERFLAALVFVNPYHYVSFFPNDLNPPLWSIGLEVSCYALLPLLFFPLWKNVRSKPWVGLVAITLVLITMQVMHFVAIEFFMTGSEQKGWEYGVIGGAKMWMPYRSTPGFMGQFICGSFAALGIAILQKRLVKPHLAFDVIAIFGCLAALTLVGLYMEPGFINFISLQPYLAPLVSLLFALILFAGHFSKFFGKCLDNRLFKHIAKLSFSLYLWHFFIMELVRLLWRSDYAYHGSQDWSFWFVASAVVILSTYGIALISYKYLEMPILALARNRQTRTQAFA